MALGIEREIEATGSQRTCPRSHSREPSVCGQKRVRKASKGSSPGRDSEGRGRGGCGLAERSASIHTRDPAGTPEARASGPGRGPAAPSLTPSPGSPAGRLLPWASPDAPSVSLGEMTANKALCELLSSSPRDQKQERAPQENSRNHLCIPEPPPLEQSPAPLDRGARLRGGPARPQPEPVTQPPSIPAITQGCPAITPTLKADAAIRAPPSPLPRGKLWAGQERPAHPGQGHPPRPNHPCRGPGGPAGEPAAPLGLPAPPPEKQ